MAEITAAAVQALRERTKLPLMKVKAALVEAEGDAREGHRDPQVAARQAR